MIHNHHETASRSKPYILDFPEINRSTLPLTGGKGANLGELCTISGIHVPNGFCITTEAYQRITGNNRTLQHLLDELAPLTMKDRERISQLSAKIRSVIESIPVPEDIVSAIIAYLSRFEANEAFAVRSSATAEDLPTASFAGQQDTYLNIIGQTAILQSISRCWASLYTERAILYRVANGFNHQAVQLAVVVQQLVFPQAAGMLFTADPITGNRKVTVIDAGFGLGEALVSGLTNADHYKISNGNITGKKIAAKKLAVYAIPEGGTKEQPVEPALQNRQVLTNEQVVQLAHIGSKIATHFGCPQDIEWCLANGIFYIVQSRPVTTLYPIPETSDTGNHVYVSVGHQQMMTDAMKPLGLSLWQLAAFRPMFKAGGRLFVDVSQQLATTAGRDMLLQAMGQHDPLIKDALLTIIERGDFITPAGETAPTSAKNNAGMPGLQVPVEMNPSIVAELMQRSETAIAALKQNIQTQSGPALFDFILQDFQQLRQSLLAPENMGVIMAAINASAWINEKMQEWLGEKNAADVLSQSQSNNITSAMGLDLLDVADVIRSYPEVMTYLQQAADDTFWDKLVPLNGGRESRDAIAAYLDKYGMRCAGEIDITHTRWSEKPTMLAPVILSHIKNFSPGAAKQKFKQGQQEALKKEQELLERLQPLPGGEKKVEETKRAISLLRNFAGYREYPKYSIISRLFLYKQALLKEADQLVQAGIIAEKEDAYYLSFEELREVVRTSQPDQQRISKRKEEYRFFQQLTPPRVITSNGEIITGKYNQEGLPANALAGLPVSSGVVEGRARVILHMEEANLEEGDILVTTFTDPGWTSLFVSLKGLVTEVGGLMTHGAVIAREYGLPAVVGVEEATKLIKDGQRIRVNGTDGYVEIL